MNISTCILTHSVQITPSKTGIHGPGTADSRFRLSKVLKLDMNVKSWPVIPHKRPYKWNETIWRCNSCALHAETCCQTRNQSPKGFIRGAIKKANYVTVLSATARECHFDPFQNWPSKIWRSKSDFYEKSCMGSKRRVTCFAILYSLSLSICMGSRIKIH